MNSMTTSIIQNVPVNIIYYYYYVLSFVNHALIYRNIIIILGIVQIKGNNNESNIFLILKGKTYFVLDSFSKVSFIILMPRKDSKVTSLRENTIQSEQVQRLRMLHEQNSFHVLLALSPQVLLAH